jgi:ABC-type sugar transport system ATPase subunit
MRILSGAHIEYDGSILVDGRPVRFASPHDAFRQGIAAIHQELSLIPSMSVIDNVFLGREQHRAGWLKRGEEARALEKVLDRIGLAVEGRRRVEEYSLAEQQMMELAKAIVFDARILIMDEPTSALNEHEARRLLRIVQDLRAAGCGIVYITHRMEEVYQVADRITVLRDGRVAGTGRAAEVGRSQLVQWMIGRSLGEQYPSPDRRAGRVRLDVRDFSVAGRRHRGGKAVDHATFSVKSGEVVGLAGLEGSGRSELLLGLFGAFGPAARGRVQIDGRDIQAGSPAESIRNGIALLTSDRTSTGLVLSMDVTTNVTLASIRRHARRGWLNPRSEADAAGRQARELGIRAASLRQCVATLSGGNQQKVALAKWLETEPDVLLLDEPTRGVDVGAKHEIYRLLNRWKSEGKAIALITSEMPELLALSDRILVLHRGRIVDEIDRENATLDRVLRSAMGDIGS